MVKMYDIASYIANFLARKVELEHSNIDSLRYGLELILGEIIKWTVLIVAAIVLNIFHSVFFAMISQALFRLISGGNHCEDYWRCLTFGAIVFLGGSKLGYSISSYVSQHNIYVVMLSISLILVLMVLIWAPGEVIYRKISQRERAFFKIFSLVFIVGWVLITVLFVLPSSIPVAVSGFIAIVVQVMSFTPPGYWIIDKFDQVLSKIVGERRCHNV